MIIDIGNYKVVDNSDRVIQRIKKDFVFFEELGKLISLILKVFLLYLCAKTFLNHLPITIDHTLFWSFLGMIILLK